MSRKVSSSIAYMKKSKSVGISTQPCLTPFVALNYSETSTLTLTFAIISVCRTSIIVVYFSRHPYFPSSCQSPVLPSVSNEVDKYHVWWSVLLNALIIIARYSIILPILFDHISCTWLQCWYLSMLVVQSPPPRHWWLVGAVCWTDCLLRASILLQEFHLPRCFAIFQAGDCSSRLFYTCNLIEACFGNALQDVVNKFMIYIARDVEWLLEVFTPSYHNSLAVREGLHSICWFQVNRSFFVGPYILVYYILNTTTKLSLPVMSFRLYPQQGWLRRTGKNKLRRNDWNLTRARQWRQ